MVLDYRVAQLIFVAEDVLCPVFAIFASIDHTLIVFGFYNEYGIF